MASLVNVRMFRVEGGDDAIAMDTLGLTTMGLPDVQCHFRGLEAGRVASLLLAMATYVFEHGDVLADGHTVRGVHAGDQWPCRREIALVESRRVVVDLRPSEPFAAGRSTN
ncbi:MAG: DUF4261 domain-containing protein [Acidimicrobiales bacterium]